MRTFFVIAMVAVMLSGCATTAELACHKQARLRMGQPGAVLLGECPGDTEILTAIGAVVPESR